MAFLCGNSYVPNRNCTLCALGYRGSGREIEAFHAQAARDDSWFTSAADAGDLLKVKITEAETQSAILAFLSFLNSNRPPTDAKLVQNSSQTEPARIPNLSPTDPKPNSN